MARWTTVWVVTTAVVAFGPRFVWDFNFALTIPALLICLGVGVGMILATIGYVRNLDELHRQIFLESAALTLGVGLVFGSTYELLEDIRLIAFEPEISHLIIVMCLTMLAGLAAGHRRYQ